MREYVEFLSTATDAGLFCLLSSGLVITFVFVPSSLKRVGA